MKLRKYQLEAKAALRAGFAGGEHRLGVSLPTGTGKTVIFSSMAQDAHAKGNRVIVLVHRDTLVKQAYEKLSQVVPASALGIVKADRNDVHAPIIVASVHTLRSPERLRQIIAPNLTIVDEAHVSVAPTYRDYYEHVGAVPGGRGFLAGFTATWQRGDRLGLGDVWQRIAFKRSMKWAVRNGFLVRPEAIQLGGELDMSSVRTIKNKDSEHYGDYVERDLQELVMVDDLLQTVIDGYHKFAEGKPAVLFAPTQASCNYFLDGMRVAGIPTQAVIAGTTKAARQWAFASFDTGTTKVLGTCTALAEGWDSPRCEVALMVRPTRSQLMFTQQVGRILRPWPGKQRGLILDFVGVCDDKDLRSVVDLSLTPEAKEVEYPCLVCGRERCDECDGCPYQDCDYRNCVCEREEDKGPQVPIPRTAKKIEGVTEVDLFAGTDARWLTTNRGIPFVQTRDHTYFVALKDGEYGVGRFGKHKQTCRCHGPGKWVASGLTSDEALEQGSDLALAEDDSVADKRAGWRQGNKPASLEQEAYALTLGITPEGMTKAQLSDAISVKIANGLLARIGV
jgi:superfamily II DNA or RNA helicase